MAAKNTCPASRHPGWVNEKSLLGQAGRAEGDPRTGNQAQGAGNSETLIVVSPFPLIPSPSCPRWTEAPTLLSGITWAAVKLVSQVPPWRPQVVLMTSRREKLVGARSQGPQLTREGRAPGCVTALTPQWHPAQRPPTRELLRNQEVGCQKVTRLLFQMVRGRGPAGRQQSALPEAPGVP